MIRNAQVFYLVVRRFLKGPEDRRTHLDEVLSEPFDNGVEAAAWLSQYEEKHGNDWRRLVAVKVAD